MPCPPAYLTLTVGQVYQAPTQPGWEWFTNDPAVVSVSEGTDPEDLTAQAPGTARVGAVRQGVLVAAYDMTVVA